MSKKTSGKGSFLLTVLYSTGYRVPGSRHRGERDKHETDTRTSQTNLKTNPTHRLTRQTTPEPQDARVATHPTTHPIKRGGGDGDGDGARTWEQRGREPDGTPVWRSFMLAHLELILSAVLTSENRIAICR